MKSFWLFFFIIVALLLVMQIYLARSVHFWLLSLSISQTTRIWIERILLTLLIYFNLSIPLRVVIRMASHTDLTFLKYVFVIPGTTWLITMMMMVALFVARDLAGWILSAFKSYSVDLGRRAFLQAAGAVSIGAPLVLTGYGSLKTSRDYEVRKISIPFKNLPSGFDGFTIAQISDIHSGVFMDEKEMMKIRELMDAEHSQIAVITGDLVDSLAEEIRPVARVFSKLQTDYGVFACMGNHDLFDDYRIISATMKDSGIQMLENTNHIFRNNGDELNLLGVNDAGKRHDFSDLKKSLQGIDPEGFKILLAHRPEFFERAERNGVDLQLSGHTHGGQIGMNIFGLGIYPTQFFHSYVKGLYEKGKSKLYVNSGVGMVFAPIRIGVRPEITLITLRSS
jgi:predicted MPP superfamily phosphohydrolase